MARIVVGVDASPGALRALAWAADEARLRLASLQVVHAYHAQALAAPLYFPSMEALPGRAAAAGARPPEEETAETLEQRAQFQEAVRRQAEDHAGSGCSTSRSATTVEGIHVRRSVGGGPEPGRGAARAVGRAPTCWSSARRAGAGFTSLLLGSVSHARPCSTPAARWW